MEDVMNSKVTGWLLTVSPIVAFTMWFFVAPDTSDMNPAQSLDKLLENKTLAYIGGLFGTLAFASILLSHALLARSLRGAGKPGATCAELASILILLLIPVILVGSGYTWEAVNEAATDKALAVDILINAEGTGNLIQIIWPLGVVLLSIALIMQKRFHVAVGYILLVIGGVGTIGGLLDESFPDAIGFSLFMGMFLMTIVMGILTIINKDE